MEILLPKTKMNKLTESQLDRLSAEIDRVGKEPLRMAVANLIGVACYLHLQGHERASLKVLDNLEYIAIPFALRQKILTHFVSRRIDKETFRKNAHYMLHRIGANAEVLDLIKEPEL